MSHSERTRSGIASWASIISFIGVAGSAMLLAGCPQDRVLGDDDSQAPDSGPPPVDAPRPDAACDMTGLWISEQHIVSTALGADQRTTTWYYYQITQEGDVFTITKGLNCAFVVDGTTTVSVNDATLEALAKNEASAPGRKGRFKVTADGQHCDYQLDPTYNVRGANKEMYLTSVWKTGDPFKPLSEFPQLPKMPPTMEDWDGDNMDGVTLNTGLGGRYVAQRDYNQHQGTVPAYAVEFGGPEAVIVKWDSQEGVSDQTAPLLRVTSTPKGDGWARFARADGRLTVVETGDHPELETCKNVQRLAQEQW